MHPSWGSSSCLAPLSRKTTSIKWTLVIWVSKCPCKGCILVLIMHYGNIIDSYFAALKLDGLYSTAPSCWTQVGRWKYRSDIRWGFPNSTSESTWGGLVVKSHCQGYFFIHRQTSQVKFVLMSAALWSGNCNPKLKLFPQTFPNTWQSWASTVRKIKGVRCQNPLWLLQIHLG